MKTRYSDLKVLVIGDIMVDIYLNCNTKKISQEAPVIICKKNSSKYTLGGAANVAENIKSLGAEVVLGGVIGNNLFGKKAYKLCKANNIVPLFITDSRPTTVKTRILANNQHLLRVDEEVETKITKENEDFLYNSALGINPDIIIIVDYDKGVVTDGLVKTLVSLNKPIFVNGKPENIQLYKNIDYLICNNYEYKQSLLNSKCKDYKELQKFLNCKGIVHTKGEKGLTVCTQRFTQEIKAHNVIEIDSVGASDTVISVLALEMFKSDIIRASKLANKAASIVVTKLGTQSILYSEIKDFINQTVGNIYMVCKCGRKIFANLVFEGVIDCKCGDKYRRYFDAVEDNYFFELVKE